MRSIPSQRRKSNTALFVYKVFLTLIGLFLILPSTQAQGKVIEQKITHKQAIKFSQLALNCINREFPNSLKLYVEKSIQIRQPHDLHPAFYGCLDWHSSVHGHWLLTRLLHTLPEISNREEIIKSLSQNLTKEKIDGELLYFTEADRRSYERAYGRAWFLQLTTELREWNSPLARQWLETLKPLEDLIVQQATEWLPQLKYPVRIGTHKQSAFALGLFLDWARTAKNKNFEKLLISRIKKYYLKDRNCPLDYEPSGEDFLSPCLMEADLMRRVLGKQEFSLWLNRFLPQIPEDGSTDWLPPGIVTNPEDPNLVHLYGVNLSRAWALENIASSLPKQDKHRAALFKTAEIHKKLGLESVTDGHYNGSHWLASFATYLMTQRGLH